MKKVLYLINYAGGAGTEKYVKNLISFLRSRGGEAHLCYAVDGELSEWARGEGVPSFSVPMRFFYDPAAASAIANYCDGHEIDVIHAQYPRENCIAVAAKKKAKRDIAVIFTSHLTIDQPGYWRFINKRVTAKNKAVISVCKEGEEILERNGVLKEKIVTVFNGIDTESAAPRDRAALSEFGVGDGDVVFIALARFAPEKGLSYMINSVAGLKKQTDKPFKVIICGKGELFDEIGAQVKECGLEDTVFLPGYRTDTAKLLSASDAFLITSASGEAMSFAILEAMASSLPILTTDVGGSAYMVKNGYECGYVVNYGDTDALIAAMKETVENKEKRLALGAAARKKAKEQFELEKLLGDVVAIYER